MRTILVTGSEGYLMHQLIKKLVADSDVAKIIGIDIKDSRQSLDKYSCIKMDVTDPSLKKIVTDEGVDTIIHAAWTFNPVHDRAMQDKVDIEGTKNILKIAEETESIKDIVYLGSTTAYGAIPENMETGLLKEDDWSINRDKRLGVKYPYSANKAFVDNLFQEFAKKHSDINLFWMRGSIVIGPNTNNIVSYIYRSPFTFGLFMFQVKGYDPPMQFITEEDMTAVLYRATKERWSGVVNVAGEGTISYTKVIEMTKRRKLVLPPWLLYPFCDILWKLRILKFPGSLVDLIRYPWAGDITRLKEKFNYHPKTTEEALREFADTL